VEQRSARAIRWWSRSAGIGAAYSAWRFGPTMAALGATLFVWFTIALAFIDQETGLLPDDLTLPLV